MQIVMGPAPGARAEDETTPGPASGLRGTDEVHLRRVLGHFLTGVTVVTALSEGRPVGMTVNSFTSLSLDPPMVLFCPHASSVTGRRIVRSGAFAVNILGSHQQRLAERFAARHPDRFGGVQVRPGATGSPIIVEALGFVDCRVADEICHGDHRIVVGEVVEADVLRKGEPLGFFRGSYLGSRGGWR
ncbi:MAG TPA: flavin reductase family protein [Actinomycetota bacterium]